jgi:hypothetical protein
MGKSMILANLKTVIQSAADSSWAEDNVTLQEKGATESTLYAARSRAAGMLDIQPFRLAMATRYQENLIDEIKLEDLPDPLERRMEDMSAFFPEVHQRDYRTRGNAGERNQTGPAELRRPRQDHRQNVPSERQQCREKGGKAYLSRSATLCIVNCRAVRVLRRAFEDSASCSCFVWIKSNDQSPIRESAMPADYERK